MICILYVGCNKSENICTCNDLHLCKSSSLEILSFCNILSTALRSNVIDITHVCRMYVNTYTHSAGM
jgi:hypothetical protein